MIADETQAFLVLNSLHLEDLRILFFKCVSKVNSNIVLNIKAVYKTDVDTRLANTSPELVTRKIPVSCL